MKNVRPEKWNETEDRERGTGSPVMFLLSFVFLPGRHIIFISRSLVTAKRVDNFPMRSFSPLRTFSLIYFAFQTWASLKQHRLASDYAI